MSENDAPSGNVSRETKPVDEKSRQALLAGLVALSMVRERLNLAAYLGKQFDGERDLLKVLGYPLDLKPGHYRAKYDRQDIAGRIVDLPAKAAFKKPPRVLDGAAVKAARDDTPFCKAWSAFADRLRLWSVLTRLDRLVGLGQYGVLLVGVDGDQGARLDQPLEGKIAGGEKSVIYLKPYGEEQATIQTWETDPSSPRFGLPLTYQVDMGGNLGSRVVHHSRVLHVAEDALEDPVMGRPRLQRVYDRLDDLIKIVGGGSEATWLLMNRGLHVDARDGSMFNVSPTAEQDLEDEIDEYVHGLRRIIRTQGVDINELGGAVVDPSGLFRIIIALLAAASDIPQRILIGSERGELASSQDQENWAGMVAARQQEYVEPEIMRPLVTWLIAGGALPAPASGSFCFDWPSLYEMSETQQSEVASKRATAAKTAAEARTAGAVIDDNEIRAWAGLPELTPEQLARLQPPEPEEEDDLQNGDQVEGEDEEEEGEEDDEETPAGNRGPRRNQDEEGPGRQVLEALAKGDFTPAAQSEDQPEPTAAELDAIMERLREEIPEFMGVKGRE